MAEIKVSQSFPGSVQKARRAGRIVLLKLSTWPFVWELYALVKARVNSRVSHMALKNVDTTWLPLYDNTKAGGPSGKPTL